MDFGLSRITRLIRDVHPKLPWKAIHIAGTNGKGTTAAFVSGLLHHSQISVGRFNSPHLLYRHDCITINEDTIDKKIFDDIEQEVKRRDHDAGLQATSFELLTATAFEVFARAKVDVGVIECGLGGAKDATNVLNSDEVLCSIITSIANDHNDVLGPDLRSIAREKAGIFKKDVPAIALTSKRIDKFLQEKAEEAGSPFYSDQVSKALSSFFKIQRSHVEPLNTRKSLEQSFGLSSSAPQAGNGVGFAVFQLKALSMAYVAIMAARKSDPDRIPERAIVPMGEALNIGREIRRKWRGRMEWISIAEFADRKAEILIDGAHNRAATTQLRKSVNDRVTIDGEIKPVTWVIAMSGSKDIPSTLSSLVQPNDNFVFTQFGPVDGMPWAMPASFERLNEGVKDLTNGRIVWSPTPGEALRAAVKMTAEEDLIVGTGSLYLIADILRIPSIADPLPIRRLDSENSTVKKVNGSR